MSKTIYLVIGPKQSGKTTLIEKLSDAINDQFRHMKSIHIDTKAFRQHITGTDNGGTCMHASEAAYDLALTTLEAYTRFPSTVNFVFFETSGMDTDFRSKIVDIAKKNNFVIELIALDVGESQIRRNCEKSNTDTHVSMRQHKKYRREVLASLNRRDYNATYTLKSVDDEEKMASIVDNIQSDGYISIYASDEDRICVVGDIHECIDEFNELYTRLYDGGMTHMILCGDLFDKGNRTAEMVNFIHYKLFEEQDSYEGRQIQVAIVRGNHERYIANALKGKLQNRDLQMEAQYFTSIKVLEADPVLAEKFLQIESIMANCVHVIRDEEAHIIVTHAPCKNKYIGKHDRISIREMNNFRFNAVRGDTKGQLEDLKFITDEANQSHPFHVFGHVAHDGSKPHRIKNKIFLDTGCVHGNKLSSVMFHKWHVDFISVDSKQPKEENSDILSFTTNRTILDRIREFEVKLDDVEERQMHRIIRGGAKYISGTMSPSPADPEKLEIESLDLAIKTFVDAGVTELFIEPKFMGSRAQAYLYKDSSKNFAVSRNGFRINIPGIEDALNELQAEIDVEYDDFVIIDAELLPWSALGSGLIDTGFKQYSCAIEQFIKNLESDKVFQNFDLAKTMDSKKMRENLNAFDDQIDIFAGDVVRDQKPYFRAFDILSIDGVVEEKKNNMLNYNKVNDSHAGLKVDTTNPEDIERLRSMFIDITTEMRMEGIVIKPLVYSVDMRCPPYMKVRNEEYLRIVYGYDYKERLEAHCNQKSTRGKTRLSIDEYEIGQAMLKNTDPKMHETLVAAMMGCLSREKSLDPRL